MTTDITNVNSGGGIITIPEYIKALPKDDLADMRKCMSPPRIKVIQPQTGEPFKPPFVDGDSIIIPQGIHIGSTSQEFTFVPVHFFQTWACFNPFKMKATLRYIRSMSFDPDSVVAKKAESFITEPCPENPKESIEYRKIMNFLIRIISPVGEYPSDPVTLVCMKGEYKQGRTLLGLIERRGAPRYVCQFNAISAYRASSDGKWYGLDFRNAPQPFVSEAMVPSLRADHEILVELVKNRQISVDLDDTDVPNHSPDKETKF